MPNYVFVNGELCDADVLVHHGVKGMKWGVRRFQKKDGSLTYAGRKRYAKEEYKRADDAAFKRYEKTISSIEKNYKRGQSLSKKDMDREDAADRRYREESAKAKAAYKQAKKDIKAEKKAANTERGGLSDKQKTALKVGAAVAGTALAAYGAYKVNQFVRERNKQIIQGRNLIEANKLLDVRLNTGMFDTKGMTNSQVEVVNKYKNAYAKQVLDQAMGSGAAQARGDSFVKAAKNVLQDELERRTRR